MNLEGFNFTKKEKVKGPESKKLLTEAKKRLSLAWKVLLISGASFMAPDQAEAQSSGGINPKTQEKYKPKIEWVAEASEKEKQELEQTINQQKEWLVDYINSPKYTERLTKERMRMEEVGIYGKDEEDYQNFLQNPIFDKFEVDTEGDTVMIVNHLGKNFEAIGKKGKRISNEDFEKIIDKGEFLDEFIPNPDITKADDHTKLKVKYTKAARLERLENDSIFIVNSIPSEIGTTVGITRFRESDSIIELRKDFKEHNGESIPLHETIHKSTGGDWGLNSVTFHLLRNRADAGRKEEDESKIEHGHEHEEMSQEYENYLETATEIHARMNELRFLLEAEGIYDAGEEDFKSSHVDQMLQNNRIMKNFAIQQLIQTLKKNDLIWFMNNVAGETTSSIEVANLS